MSHIIAWTEPMHNRHQIQLYHVSSSSRRCWSFIYVVGIWRYTTIKPQSIWLKNRWHCIYHHQGHNHHINQSHSKIWLHYIQNSGNLMRTQMLHILNKISIGEIDGSLWVYTEGEESPPCTLISISRNCSKTEWSLKNEIELQEMHITQCVSFV